jgi:uncharacterized membrane protein
MASYAAPSWLTVSQPMPGLSAWPFAAAASGGAFVGGTAGAAARREGSGATGATWATARAAGFSFGLPQGLSEWEFVGNFWGIPFCSILFHSVSSGDIFWEYWKE